jgi:hypothetical protein
MPWREPGSRLRGAENPQSFALKSIHDARRERVIRPDDREADALALRECHERVVLGDFDRNTRRDLRDAAISRRAIHRRHTRRLFDFPSQRVLPPAAANDEDFHAGAELAASLVDVKTRYLRECSGKSRS